MMFGVLVKTSEGMYFKVFEDLAAAQYYAKNTMVCGFGFSATVFDYDKEDKTFLEFYEI